MVPESAGVEKMFTIKVLEWSVILVGNNINIRIAIRFQKVDIKIP